MLESATTRELVRLLTPFNEQIGITSAALLTEKKHQNDTGRTVIEEEADRRKRTVEAFLKAIINELGDTAKAHLLADGGLWKNCEEEWGKGIKEPGYKKRVAGRFDQWGVDHSPQILGELVDAAEQANGDDSGILRALIEG